MPNAKKCPTALWYSKNGILKFIIKRQILKVVRLKNKITPAIILLFAKTRFFVKAFIKSQCCAICNAISKSNMRPNKQCKEFQPEKRIVLTSANAIVKTKINSIKISTTILDGLELKILFILCLTGICTNI